MVKKTLKLLLFMFLPTFIILISLEASTRVLIFISNGKSQVLFYGFNDTSLKIDSLKKLEFNITTDKQIFKKSDTNGGYKKFSDKINVWTFGGSSTFGYNCGTTASSWPDELQKIYPSLNVSNFGRNGTDSSYALEKLKSEVYYNVPDIVIWANRPNETDFLTTGKTSHPEILNKLGDKNFNGQNILLFNKSFIKTIKSYSSLLLITDYVLARLLSKINPNHGHKSEAVFDESTIALAALNYRLNIEQAIKLSETLDFDFVILTLFNIPDMKKTFYQHPDWNVELFHVKKEMALKENVFWFNSIEDMPDSKNYSDFFCDPTHQTLKGNIVTAKIVADKMRALNF